LPIAFQVEFEKLLTERLIFQKMTLCGTPGCTFTDFHKGIHSFEVDLNPRTEQNKSSDMTHNGNKFQLGREFIMDVFIQNSKTSKLCLPGTRKKIKEKWLRHQGNTLVRKNKNNLAKIEDYLDPHNREFIPKCLSTHLLNYDEHVRSSGHPESQMRMEKLAHYLSFYHGSDMLVLSLDGDGTNKKAFEDKADPAVKFLTIEMDPTVCLAQKILFTGEKKDDEIIFAKHGIEDLIIKENDTLTKEQKENVIALNLDYCGGFINGLDFDKGIEGFETLLSRLPRLFALIVTVSKRQRPNLEEFYDRYVPTPYGFQVVETFINNKKVVSKLFLRKPDVPRTFLIPSSYWFEHRKDHRDDPEEHHRFVFIRHRQSNVELYAPYDNSVQTCTINELHDWKESDPNIDTSSLNHSLGPPALTFEESNLVWFTQLRKDILQHFEQQNQQISDLKNIITSLCAKESSRNVRLRLTGITKKTSPKTISSNGGELRFKCKKCGGRKSAPNARCISCTSKPRPIFPPSYVEELDD
jgi:hypothetical protein